MTSHHVIYASLHNSPEEEHLSELIDTVNTEELCRLESKTRARECEERDRGVVAGPNMVNSKQSYSFTV